MRRAQPDDAMVRDCMKTKGYKIKSRLAVNNLRSRIGLAGSGARRGTSCRQGRVRAIC